jgi:hypothetical protein
MCFNAYIAVLVQPDPLLEPDKAKGYDTLMESLTPLELTDAPLCGPGWLLGPDGKWFACTMEHFGNSIELWAERSAGGEEYVHHSSDDEPGGPLLLITDSEKPITRAMKGAPILDNMGRAVGIVRVNAYPYAIFSQLSQELSETELNEVDRALGVCRET